MFVQYVKTYDSCFELINKALFGLDGELKPVLCEISKEAFDELLNERKMPDLSGIGKQKLLQFAKSYLPKVVEMFGIVHRTFLSLYTTIRNCQHQMRKASVVEKKRL